ncbi:MAG: hypothetical protein IJ619_09165 [Eubacterium sp.]|nr:hypothetical protein [Eubacterium sp.]
MIKWEKRPNDKDLHFIIGNKNYYINALANGQFRIDVKEIVDTTRYQFGSYKELAEALLDIHFPSQTESEDYYKMLLKRYTSEVSYTDSVRMFYTEDDRTVAVNLEQMKYWEFSPAKQISPLFSSLEDIKEWAEYHIRPVSDQLTYSDSNGMLSVGEGSGYRTHAETFREHMEGEDLTKYKARIFYDVWENEYSYNREQHRLCDVDLAKFIEKYGDWIWEGSYTTGNENGRWEVDIWAKAARPYCFSGHVIDIESIQIDEETEAAFEESFIDLDFDAAMSEWELVDVKDIHDSDGMFTDYSLYKKVDEEHFVCIFGDRDFYNPVICDPDAEFDNYDEARDWFDNYRGFDRDYDEYTPSSTRGDYSPSNPWNAPGMSIRDFI